jgi:hypothetical protein
MRTTLTLDDDVAAILMRLRKSQDRSLKELVNEALRLGLKTMNRPPKPGKPFRTAPLDAGRCLIGNVDNIAEVLSIIEGELHR